MYCPTCAGLNNNDSKFCRVCGADLSLIADAMTGRLRRPAETSGACKAKMRRPDSVQKAIPTGFMGLGFIVVALALILTGESWGIWLFIPGFMWVGRAVSIIAGAKLSQPSQPTRDLGFDRSTAPQSPRTGELTPPPGYATPHAGQPDYAEIPLPPPSVTEGTTRIIDPSVQRARDRN